MAITIKGALKISINTIITGRRYITLYIDICC